MKRFQTLLFLMGIALIPVFQSCKPAYVMVPFEQTTLPKAPDYSQESSWAVLPNNYPQGLKKILGTSVSEKEIDVFFIYPTLFVDRKARDWNADIYNAAIRSNVEESAVTYQASAWGKAANIYVPFYRQTHYRIFVPPHNEKGQPAWEISYQDIKAAFTYYLQHFNQGKGIILAAHSQGTLHSKRLLKEFFDGTPLQDQLVAAYLIGARILPNEFTNIKPMETPQATGGFVSWNTYKRNKLPANYTAWYKGGVTTNPILWDASVTAPASAHKGVLNRDLKIYPNSLSIQKTDGMLWSSLPKIPKRLLLSFVKSYHFADINLFWEDISHNAQLRATAWLNKSSKNAL